MIAYLVLAAVVLALLVGAALGFALSSYLVKVHATALARADFARDKAIAAANMAHAVAAAQATLDTAKTAAKAAYDGSMKAAKAAYDASTTTLPSSMLPTS